jgi:hypothetical protein
MLRKRANPAAEDGNRNLNIVHAAGSKASVWNEPPRKVSKDALGKEWGLLKGGKIRVNQ